MKFIIKVKDANGITWNEEYDKNIPDAQIWAEEIIKNFNGALKPCEFKRELISVTVIDDDNGKYHKWVKRTDGMSVNFRGCTVDLMYCGKCKITGKRYGLQDNVVIDSKFRAKKYQRCDTATGG